MKKEYGGSGIPNLQGLSIYLIGSSINNYIHGEGTLLKRVIDTKYNTKDPNILCCHGDKHQPFGIYGVM